MIGHFHFGLPEKISKKIYAFDIGFFKIRLFVEQKHELTSHK